MEKNSISSLFDVVPHLYSTEYVPYPMFIGIENIIKVDLNHGAAKVEMPYGPTQIV